MMFRTHLVFSLLVGLIVFGFFDLNKYLFVLFVLIAGVIPDVDHPKSKIGRKFFLKPISFLFGHRGFFHSLFFVVILCCVVWFFFDKWWIPFAIGYVSHLFIDCFTKAGINIIYPFKQLRLSGFIRTGGWIEVLLFYVLVGCNVLIIIKNINVF